MKRILVFVLAVGGIGAGFYAGRLSSVRVRAPEPTRAAERSDGEAAQLAKAERRIAELERKLAAARKPAARPRRDAAGKAEDVQPPAPPADADVVTLGGSTNLDIVAELKKNLSEEEFEQATNAMARLKERMATKAQDRLAFLKSIDTSAMTAAEREGHERFLELTEKREAVRAKMKFGLPNQQTLQEMMELEMQLVPLAKAERAALSRELARELDYSGADIDVLQDAIGNIFDCTAGGLDGMMDAAEGVPGVEVGADVQVLTL